MRLCFTIVDSDSEKVDLLQLQDVQEPVRNKPSLEKMQKQLEEVLAANKKLEDKVIHIEQNLAALAATTQTLAATTQTLTAQVKPLQSGHMALQSHNESEWHNSFLSFESALKRVSTIFRFVTFAGPSLCLVAILFSAFGGENQITVISTGVNVAKPYPNC